MCCSSAAISSRRGRFFPLLSLSLAPIRLPIHSHVLPIKIKDRLVARSVPEGKDLVLSIHEDDRSKEPQLSEGLIVLLHLENHLVQDLERRIFLYSFRCDHVHKVKLLSAKGLDGLSHAGEAVPL